ncbi:hypothetical protein OTU49_010036 [Cherax quadricarinatus]|uniref:Uncharacterized protein n=3 Tax=Cherax quadricarinatus TaxID=27406 RepID=A0AAW0WI49_CHEQU
MELLAHNLKQIQDDWRRSRGLDSHRELPVVFVFHNSVLFVFPYFMEQQVISSLPSFTMLDYQVDYDNHPLYSSGPKGMKNGSAVRVFVNLPQSMFPLPEESYHLCKVCDRWVSINNQHCDKCNGCMSKDGRTYKHCDGCNKCVKPSWVHCSDCSRCQPHDHRCQEAGSALTCHMCGHSGHKRMDCPKRKLGCTLSDDESKRKRRKRNKNTLPLSLEDERMRRKTNKNTLPLSLEDERMRRKTNKNTLPLSLEDERMRRKTNKNTLPLSLEDERMRRKTNKNTLPLSLEDERKRNMEIFSQLT